MFPEPPTMTIPLRMDDSGGIRVSGTRVTLDVIIIRYHQGNSPEAIHESFDTVPVTDIYAIIAYYLAHRDELDAYLDRRNEEAKRIRQETEANYTPQQREFYERLRRLAAKQRRQQSE